VKFAILFICVSGLLKFQDLLAAHINCLIAYIKGGRRMCKRIFLVLLASCVFLAGCGDKDDFAYEFEAEYGEVHDIDDFFLQFFNKTLQMDPETATWVGEYDGHEANRKDDKLTEISFEFRLETMKFYKNSLEVLLSFDDNSLSQEQRLNKDVLVWFLNKEIEGEPFIYHDYLVNQFNGIPASLPSFAQDHHINSVEDAENYISRLKAFPWKLAQLTEGIKKQLDLGIAPPGYIFSAFAASVSQFTSPAPSSNSLYTTFVTKLDECSEISEEEKARLKAEALEAVKTHVYGAYKDLHKYLLPIVRDPSDVSVSSGVWELPQGDEYYAYIVSKHTTTDLTPQDIHEMGLLEVERIHGEIRNKLISMGVEDPDPVRYLINLGNQDLVRDRGEILAEYSQAVEEAKGLLPEYFNTLPQGSVHVEPVPSHREATYANHYAWPAPDGSRPGIFFVNVSYPHARCDIEALAFHETVPGHHLQIALQLESDLPGFRALVGTTAYPEGWALYAEKLMYENGCYSDPQSELGYLKSELFRAARLVIDTGIHYKQWSRREAIEYLRERTGLRWENEIDRYTVWPGQALAYKVGELKILELRDIAMEQLGDKFDLKEFHDVILSTGSVPMEVLEQEVMRYIEEKK